MLAVTQHRGGVADLIDLVHAVRDVEDRVAAASKVPDDFEEPLGFLFGERAGRLVERHDLRAAAERLGDLDHLALGQRQAAEFFAGIDLLADQLQQTRGFRPQRRAIEKQAAARIATDEQVLRHGHLGHEVKFLVDDRDARGEGLGCGMKDLRLAAQPQATGGRVIGAAEDLEQCGFARAILAHQGMDAAAANAERHAVERAHARELHGEGVEGESGGVGRHREGRAWTPSAPRR